MSESFAELFEESQNELNFSTGAIVTGTVIEIGPKVVVNQRRTEV